MDALRRFLKISLVVGTAGLMSGCGAAFPGSQTLVVTPLVSDRQVLATVTPYLRSDVATLVISLRVLDGANETAVAEKTLSNSQLDSSVAFANLRSYTAYRIRAFAFKADSTKISQDDQSFLDLVTTNDASPTLASLPVKLLDTPFSGQASSGAIAVTDGALVPAGVETISQP